MDNCVSFKSGIQFVSLREFKKIAAESRDFIEYLPLKENIIRSDDFSTTNIRTCCAGGLVRPYRNKYNKKSLIYYVMDFSNASSVK